jgi:branched-chain amino acid aminotransferase
MTSAKTQPASTPAKTETKASAPRRIWLDGKLVAPEQAVVSVYDHGLLYGDGCFEGIRVYDGRIFKLRSHLKRMYASAEKIRLVPPYDIDQFEQAVRDAVAANGLRDAYIRAVFTRGVGTLGLHPFRCPRGGAFVIVDKIQLYPEELYQTGMKVIVAKRPRIPIACLDPAIKSLNYLNNILAKIEAIDADVLEAIMLNLEGFVSECTGDNVFFVKGRNVVTPPTGAGILHGVTRRFVLDEVAPAQGLKPQERPFKLDELLQADEVFLTGTAAEIIGVSQIDEHRIGRGGVGPVTRGLAEEFRKRVRANAPED